MSPPDSSNRTMRIVTNEKQQPFLCTDNYVPQRFHTGYGVIGHNGIGVGMYDHTHSGIVSMYDRFAQVSCNREVSLLSYGNNATPESNLEEHVHRDDRTAITLITQTIEGKTEHLTVPKAAANIISALQNEADTLRLEIARLRLERQTKQETQHGIAGRFVSTPSHASNGTNEKTVNTYREKNEESNIVPLMAEKTTKSIPESTSTRKRKAEDPDIQSEKIGRWSTAEHKLFLQGLKIHGRSWIKIATIVTTRTDLQIRTHAQKYFKKLAKANGINREDLDDETIYRLAETEIISITESEQKKGRFGNEKKISGMADSKIGSASAVFRSNTAYKGKHAVGMTKRADSLLLAHTGRSSILQRPVAIATKPTLSVGNTGYNDFGMYTCGGVEKLKPVISSSPTIHENTRVTTPLSSMVDSTSNWSKNTCTDSTSQLDTAAEGGFDAETMKLLLQVDLLTDVGLGTKLD